MNEIKLKPCPFCGGTVKTDSQKSLGLKVTYVLCDSCGACVSFRGKESLKDTAAQWNSRMFTMNVTQTGHGNKVIGYVKELKL